MPIKRVHEANPPVEKFFISQSVNAKVSPWRNFTSTGALVFHRKLPKLVNGYQEFYLFILKNFFYYDHYGPDIAA